MPIQLAHELQMSSENRVGRLESLLDTIKARGFNIGCILADSEFASGRMANMLKEHGIDFVIQVPTYWVSSIVGNFKDYFGVHSRYTMNKNKSYPDRSTNTLFASRETKLGKQKHPAADDAQKALLDFFEPAPEYLLVPLRDVRVQFVGSGEREVSPSEPHQRAGAPTDPGVPVQHAFDAALPLRVRRQST